MLIAQMRFKADIHHLVFDEGFFFLYSELIHEGYEHSVFLLALPFAFGYIYINVSLRCFLAWRLFLNGQQ
jgi:hypothetical protein